MNAFDAAHSTLALLEEVNDADGVTAIPKVEISYYQLSDDDALAIVRALPSLTWEVRSSQSLGNVWLTGALGEVKVVIHLAHGEPLPTHPLVVRAREIIRKGEK